MIYDKISDSELVAIYEGFDCDMHKKVKSCIVTDGCIEEVESDFLPIESVDSIKLINNNSNLEKVIKGTSNFTSKKIQIDNANFISMLYYVFLNGENKWYLYNVEHKLNKKFNLLGEAEFILHQDLIPISYVVDDEPKDIIVNKLNEKVKSKRLKKKYNK